MALALLVFSIIPRDIVLRESCESVEVNEFIDENGRTIFHQAIFKNEDESVRAWRLIKSSHQQPQRDWQRGGYSAAWYDGEVLREVTAKSMYHTFTQWDPELEARSLLPKEKRKELRTLQRP